MTTEASRVRRRHWADLLVIVAGVWCVAESVWGPAIFSQDVQESGVGYNWFAFGIGGLLTVLAIFVAQRRLPMARLMLVIAGALLLIVPIVYRTKPLLPIATSVLLGLLILGTTPFVGRMPRDLPKG